MVQHRSIRYRTQTRPFFGKGIFFFLLFTGIFFYLFWLWNKIFVRPHRFDFLVFSINGELKKILNGETIILHPMDRVRLLNISTNVPFNLYIRLFSRNIDINALRYEEKLILSLLPEKKIYKKYRFHIEVKFKNKELGYINCIVKPSFEDWLKRFAMIKELDKKKDFLNKGFSLFPGQKEELIRIKLDLARTFQKNRKLNQAIKMYLEVLEYSENMEKNRVISIYETLAHLYSQIKKYREAIRYYELAIGMGDKNPEIYYNIHKLYNIVGDKSRSAYYLSKLLEFKPKDIKTRLELAKILLEKGDIKMAERYVSEALSINPDSLEALSIKAEILDKKGDKKGLIEVYKKMLAFEPKNETIIYNLAVLEYELNNLDKALLYLKDYIARNPKDVDAHELLYQIYRAKKMGDMAYKEAKVLISINPKLVYPYYFLFNYLWSKGRCDEIIPIINKGIMHNPKDVTLRKYIVLCYLDKGKDALAIREINRILKLKPNDVVTLLQMARLMEKIGNYSKAMEIYKKIIKIAPENEEAQNGYLDLRLKIMKEKEE